MSHLKKSNELGQLVFLITLSTLLLVNLVAQAQSSTSTSTSNDINFELECLAEHNKWRSMHGVDPLSYDPKLSAYAMQRARKVARSGYLWHAQSNKFGENLAWHSWTSTSCATLVKMWHDEVYRVAGRQLLKQANSFSTRQLITRAGHFTQLVWNSSRRVGCARALGASGVYLVCLYDPAGNVISRKKDYRSNLYDY